MQEEDIQDQVDNYNEFVLGLLSPKSRTTGELPGWQHELLTAALGLAGEAGEVVDWVKKLVYHERKYTDEVRTAMLKELGDLRWYYQLFLEALGANDEEVRRINVEKLTARYPEGTFSHERDINRPS